MLKINRLFVRTAPFRCPVIVQDKHGYDVGTCAKVIDNGECPDHKNVRRLIDANIPINEIPEHVWFIRRDPFTGDVVASAQLNELQLYGLINEEEVITPKTRIPLKNFKRYSKHPGDLQYIHFTDEKLKLRAMIFD